MLQLIVEDKFSAAHRLIGYEGNCKYIHGHTWRVHIEFRGRFGLNRLGMVQDFRVLKRMVREWLDKNWEHSLLLSKDDDLCRRLLSTDAKIFLTEMNPTAEMLAGVLFVQLESLCRGSEVDVVMVHIFESDTASVMCIGE